MTGAVMTENMLPFAENFGLDEWGDLTGCNFDADELFLAEEDLKFADHEMQDTDLQDLIGKLDGDDFLGDLASFSTTNLDCLNNEPLSPDSAISCNYSSPSSPGSQSADYGKVSPAHSSGSLSDSAENIKLYDVYPSGQEKCIVQEMDTGVSFTAANSTASLPQLQPKIAQTNNVTQIKPEKQTAQPCNVNPTVMIQQMKQEPVATQCTLHGFAQAVDQKPVITKVVQKLPLPRNAKQSPIFIQPVNGNVPAIQTMLPVTTTHHPQIQTVNLISTNAPATVLNPVLLQTAVSGSGQKLTCIPVSQPLSGNIAAKSNSVMATSSSHPTVLPSKSASQLDADMKILRRQQRMIKNRESACLSRKKKKEYLQCLEAQLNEAVAQNELIRQENERLKQRLTELENENNTFRKLAGVSINPNVAKSTCVLVILLFVALNFKGLSDITSKVEPQSLIASSLAVHHGRALLEYTDKYNIDVEKFSPPRASQSSTPANDRVSRRRKNSLMRQGLVSERNSRKTVGSTLRNITRNARPPICQSDKLVNETENNRLNGVLELVVRKHEMARMSEQLRKRNFETKEYARSPISELAMKIQQNTTEKSDLRSFILKGAPSSSSKELQVASKYTGSFQSFQQAFDRQADTFYVLSFRKDHIMFPATEFNSTNPPKMSFILPAPNGDSKWKTKKNYVPMMRMDCQLLNTKRVFFKKSNIPTNLMDMSYLYTPFVESDRRDD